MDSFDPKFLKKLAKACRDAGIYQFKGHGVEFTLGDLPEKHHKRLKEITKTKDFSPDSQAGIYAQESLSEEQLLSWSVGLGESEQKV